LARISGMGQYGTPRVYATIFDGYYWSLVPLTLEWHTYQWFFIQRQRTSLKLFKPQAKHRL